MADLIQLLAGSEVSCTDGRVGHLHGLIVDAQGRFVTHLSVDSRGPSANGRLVSLDHLESGGQDIHLSCTKAEYHEFLHNEEVDAVGGPRGGVTIDVHLIPEGETEVKPKENIVGTDGRSGHLLGLAIDAIDHSIQKLLVLVGHFSHRHQVSIPLEVVTSVERNGIHVNLSRDQISNLGNS